MSGFEIHRQVLAVRTVHIGRGAGCALRLRDPVVAERHCRIEATAAGFVLHDEDSPTGTYLAGHRVQRDRPLPIGNGDVITIGSSRIRVEIRGPEPVCVLVADERKFHFLRAAYKKDDSGQLRWESGDREQWRESELAFGSFPLLWNVVWAALAVAIVALGATALPAGRELLMQPGALDAAHAGVDGMTCSSCHVEFGSQQVAKCLVCHPHIEAAHPMPLPGSTAGVPFDCAPCHQEHRGTARQLQLVTLPGHANPLPVLRRDPRFVPAADQLDGTCSRCHGEHVPTVPAASGPVRRGPTHLEAIPYDGFDHAAHLARGIACDRCHLANATRTDRLRDRDFVRFGYRDCLGCHADGPAAAGRTTLAFDAERDAPRLRAADAWHGLADAGAHCATCHAGDPRREPRRQHEPRSMQRHAVPAVFAIGGRPHGAEFAAHAGRDGDCAGCHKAGVPQSAPPPRPFDHALHCTQLPVGRAATADEAERLVPECRQCHVEMERAMALANPYLGPPVDTADAACASCHGGAPIPAPRGEPGTALQRDFPHAPHLSRRHERLANGCLSCHQFAPADATRPAAGTTRPEARDCASCHDESHSMLGGGSCRRCHAADDPCYRRAVGDADWPHHRERTRFSHFSEGHVELLREPCGSCHEQLTGAHRVTTIPAPPTEHSPQCRGCHVDRQRRFHRPH